jgi:hypothetical protein
MEGGASQLWWGSTSCPRAGYVGRISGDKRQADFFLSFPLFTMSTRDIELVTDHQLALCRDSSRLTYGMYCSSSLSSCSSLSQFVMMNNSSSLLNPLCRFLYIKLNSLNLP